MNRFAALDIDEYEYDEPDIVEQERELAENVVEAKKAGMGPQLEDLERLRVLQMSGGSVFAKGLLDGWYKNPETKKQLDALYAETKFSDLVTDERNRGAVKINTEQYPVQWLQKLLNKREKGSRLAVDGILGPHTLGLAVRTPFWLTREGKTYAPREMSDTHLLNAARMLMRSERRDRDVMLKVFEFEANQRRGLL